VHKENREQRSKSVLLCSMRVTHTLFVCAIFSAVLFCAVLAYESTHERGSRSKRTHCNDHPINNEGLLQNCFEVEGKPKNKTSSIVLMQIKQLLARCVCVCVCTFFHPVPTPHSRADQGNRP
jgi:hypothetical protein